jgi:hypothetical protein
MIDDYDKYVREPYKKCEDIFCSKFGLKFYKITITPINVGLWSDCEFCGSEKKDTVARADMFHFFKLFLQRKNLGSQFRKFRLGLSYDSLFENEDARVEYKKFFLEMIYKMRETELITEDGKKYIIKDLGKSLIGYLNDL